MASESECVRDPDRAHLSVLELTRAHEDTRAAPWAVNDAPPEFVAAQLRGIVGVEIPIARTSPFWSGRASFGT